MVAQQIVSLYLRSSSHLPLIYPNLRKLVNFTMPFYAVAKGKKCGVFDTWAECQAMIHNCKHAKYKKFENREEAVDFINMFKGDTFESTSMVAIPSPPPVDEFESISEEMFLSDDFNENPSENDVDSVLREHLDRIDEIAESYKKSITDEFVKFKSRLLTVRSDNCLTTRNICTSAQVNKRKNSPKEPVSMENVQKKTKLDPFDSEKPRLPVDKNGFVHVYTDGACENNGKFNAKAGLGVWFGPYHPLNVGEPVKGRATNNVGEIQACTRAIHIAAKAGATKLCINTDSQFVINAMTTWLPGWKKRNWTLKDGGPVKNKVDFIELDNATKLLEVKWNFVKGHAGTEGNEGADALAREGAVMYAR